MRSPWQLDRPAVLTISSMLQKHCKRLCRAGIQRRWELMAQHTDFSTRLDVLQQPVATARSAVQAAESEAQLRQRIDHGQAC